MPRLAGPIRDRSPRAQDVGRGSLAGAAPVPRTRLLQPSARPCPRGLPLSAEGRRKTHARSERPGASPRREPSDWPVRHVNGSDLLGTPLHYSRGHWPGNRGGDKRLSLLRREGLLQNSEERCACLSLYPGHVPAALQEQEFEVLNDRAKWPSDPFGGMRVIIAVDSNDGAGDL